MPEVAEARCRLCWGDGSCWCCRGDGVLHIVGADDKPCPECAPGTPGRCEVCEGSGERT